MDTINNKKLLQLEIQNYKRLFSWTDKLKNKDNIKIQERQINRLRNKFNTDRQRTIKFTNK